MHIKLSAFNAVLALVVLLPECAFSLSTEIDQTTQSVTIGDVTPGGEVAVVWASRQHGIVQQTSWDTFVVADDDRDGEIVLINLEEAILPGALWSVVDVASGSFAAYRFESPPSLASDITQGARSIGETVRASDTVSVPGGRVSLLLVRPGVGVWYSEIYDGTENDSDGDQDHVVTTKPGMLGPGGRAPEAPPSTLPDDIIVGLDSRAMIVTITIVS